MTARFDAVGLVVADMRASVSFYRLLGLEFPDPSGAEGHLEAHGAGGFRLMLDTEAVVTAFDPSWTPPPPGAGRVRLAFDCVDPGGVDRLHAAAVAAGHASQVQPFDAFWGQRYASLLDPDGNPVDLYAALPDAAGPA